MPVDWATKQVKWLPFFSGAAVLLALFIGGFVINLVVGLSVFAIVFALLTGMATLTPPHYEKLYDFWMDTINPSVHQILLAIFGIVALIGIGMMIRGLKIDINITSNSN